MRLFYLYSTLLINIDMKRKCTLTENLSIDFPPAALTLFNSSFSFLFHSIHFLTSSFSSRTSYFINFIFHFSLFSTFHQIYLVTFSFLQSFLFLFFLSLPFGQAFLTLSVFFSFHHLNPFIYDSTGGGMRKDGLPWKRSRPR